MHTTSRLASVVGQNIDTFIGNARLQASFRTTSPIISRISSAWTLVDPPSSPGFRALQERAIWDRASPPYAFNTV
jgi:hypothetical protein